MGLITKEVEINLTNNIKYFENKKYKIPRIKDDHYRLIVPKNTKLLVNVEDLPNGSHVKVDIESDYCGKELKNIEWYNYLKCVKEDRKYYCHDCSMKIYGGKNIAKSKLKNTISFEQWCLDNNRYDILDRWDYELNNYKPNEVCYGSSRKKYYFKCPKGVHKSELKDIVSFINGQEGSIQCNSCNSFAQWGIDNLDENFLDKYWDWEKNTKNPWNISYGSHNFVYIKCQEKDYHGSYKVSCNEFINGSRCSFCSNFYGRVHPLDSLGTLYPQVLEIWSDKNKKSPYEYTKKSNKFAWWKCPDGKHEDYYRKISDANRYNFRCPECQYSKGEESISNYFIKKGFIKIDQCDFIRLIDKDKYNKNYYIPQKEFDGLIGLKGGLLSYDFYIPKLNLLIEFQGIQHEKYIKGFHKSYEDFLKQLEHDKRKKEYAQSNNINLLEIWYYNFDRIEEILERELDF